MWFLLQQGQVRFRTRVRVDVITFVSNRSDALRCWSLIAEASRHQHQNRIVWSFGCCRMQQRKHAAQHAVVGARDCRPGLRVVAMPHHVEVCDAAACRPRNELPLCRPASRMCRPASWRGTAVNNKRWVTIHEEERVTLENDSHAETMHKDWVAGPHTSVSLRCWLRVDGLRQAQ